MKCLSLVVLAMLVLTFSYIQNAETASKICHSCSSDYVPGTPVDGGKTLGDLALIAQDISDRDSIYMSDLSIYCDDFYSGKNAKKNIREVIIPSMKKFSPNKSINGFFIEAGCNPNNFVDAKAPIAHITAEAPNLKSDYLKILKEYFTETKEGHFFKEILNAKNTEGYTTLDYVHYMVKNKNYTKVSENDLNEYIKYLCDNKAEYSFFKEKKCNGKKVILK